MKGTLRIAALVLAGLVAREMRAEAQVLYWLVSADSVAGTDYANFDYAQVFATDGTTTYALGGETATSENAVLAENRSYYYSAVKSADGSSISQKSFTILENDVSTWSSYSFYVELVNASDGQWDTLKRWVWSYADLVAEGYIVAAGSLPEIHLLGSGGGAPLGDAVPEPSSGLLLLVGGALLSLRRRRARYAAAS